MAALVDESLALVKYSLRYLSSLFPAKLTSGSGSETEAGGDVCS